MSSVLSKNAPASHGHGGQRHPSGDSRNSVYEARWLLVPVLVLAIILAAAGLFA